MPIKANKGWFEKCKNRAGIHSVVRYGVAACSMSRGLVDTHLLQRRDGPLLEEAVQDDLHYGKGEGIIGHKPMEDRITLLFWSNASNNFKSKPLFVYHSDNSRAFRKCNIQKGQEQGLDYP